jgi:hypothetical protein
VTRLWSRVGVRVTAIALLVLGVVGGFYLGQGREVQTSTIGAQVVSQSSSFTEADEMQLLKARQAEHAAARAWRTQAEGEAAAKAASEAKAAAGKARKLEQKVIAEKKAAEEKAKSDSGDSGSGSSKPYDGPIPASCNEYSGNKKIGCALMLDAGFGIDQFPCLDKLWTKESHWRVNAHNSSSGAHGIPQALPGSKMASVADDWKTNPATQIKWGLGYIEGRYDTPCGAWKHSQNSGWY